MGAKIVKLSLVDIFLYFKNLKLKHHKLLSLSGFFLYVITATQILSGIMLSFSLITDPMLIPMSREFEDRENLYTDDWFWIHERGVDLLIILIYIHLLRKYYYIPTEKTQIDAWRTGSLLFVLLHLVIFTGLVLCCTHLSDVTLTIVANAISSLVFFKSKIYWWFFTDKSLNTDTIVRLTLGHYCLGMFFIFYSVYHGIEMHVDWKPSATNDFIEQELYWFGEGLKNEKTKMIVFLLIFWIFSIFVYEEPEALSYEIFMWGDIGMINDIRYYSIAPHWYFRPHMSWLLVCPYHYLGIGGLGFFFITMIFQANIINNENIGTLQTKSKLQNSTFKNNSILINFFNLNKINVDNNLQWVIGYTIYLAAILNTLSFLPYGRFYVRIGGNFMFLNSYLFIFIYQIYTPLKINWTLNSTTTAFCY